MPAIYDAVPVGLCLIDRDLRFVSLNRRMAEMTGRSVEANIGRSLTEVTPGVAEQLEPLLLRALRGEPVADLELRGTQAGTVCEGRVYLASLEPLQGEDGAIAGVLCSALDITERRRAETALRESERRAREQAALIEAVYAAAPVGLAFHDRCLRYLAINDRLAAINGRPASETIGRTPGEIFDRHLAEAVEGLHRQVIETGLPVEGVEIRATTPARPGVERDFLASYHPVRGADGGVQGVSVAVLEITARKRAEASLRESEEFARGVLESSLDCVEVLDLEGHLLFMNGPGLRLMEIEDFARVEGRPWFSLLPADAAAEARRAIEAARTGCPMRFTAFCPTAKGTPKWWDVLVSPILGAAGDVVRLLSVSRDITERLQAERRIAYLAHHDALTGLENRLLFRQRLEQALVRADPGGQRLAVHCLDLDQFKGVNDTLGHPAGDALLRQAAERLRTCVREGDTIARLGGDEFAIIQSGVRRPEDAARLARRVIEALEKTYEVDGRQVAVGASVGIALAPDDATTPDEIMKDADIALYRAKADGRGTFRFFEPEMDEAVRLKQEVKAGLRTALARDELELHFQPVVGLCTNELTCFEALLRWRRPCRGLVPPADFIPVAEETGLIVPVGEWALRAACREAVTWPLPARIAVNLSPVQFRSPGLLRAVACALAESGLAAERLELEITESVLLQDDEANLATLRQLRAMGVRIALDDFGTGYSALGYLRRFPFDKVKIDRSFVADIPERDDSHAIVRAIIGLGRSLGISVAAEGVQTTGQLEVLRSEGCGEAQGYFFSHPVPAGEVPAVIRKLQRTGRLVA